MNGRAKVAVMLLVLVTVAAGCHRVEIDPGHIGRERSPSGWSKTILKPGRHTLSSARSKVVLLDVTEDIVQHDIEVLTTEKVNVKCTVEVRYSANTDDKVIPVIFDKVQADTLHRGLLHGTISRQRLYQVYGQPEVVAATKATIRPYSFEEILSAAMKIEVEALKRIREGDPVEEGEEVPKKPVSFVTIHSLRITNFDWPDAITKAMEAKKQREIEKDAEKARIEQKLIEAEGRRRVAEEDYKVDMLKAKAIADRNKLIAESLESDRYLHFMRIKMMEQFAESQNNAIILVPYESLKSDGGNEMLQTAFLQKMAGKDGQHKAPSPPKPPVKK